MGLLDGDWPGRHPDTGLHGTAQVAPRRGDWIARNEGEGLRHSDRGLWKIEHALHQQSSLGALSRPSSLWALPLLWAWELESSSSGSWHGVGPDRSLERAISPRRRRVVAQVGRRAWRRPDRAVEPHRRGNAAVGRAAGNPELAEVLKWTAAMPALGPLVQNGSYQKALEEAVRQNASNIAQIRLDQVASPEIRAVLAEVLQVVAKSPQGAEAASTVSANVLNMLRSEAFARLTAKTPNSPGSYPAPRPPRETE